MKPRQLLRRSVEPSCYRRANHLPGWHRRQLRLSRSSPQTRSTTTDTPSSSEAVAPRAIDGRPGRDRAKRARRRHLCRSGVRSTLRIPLAATSLLWAICRTSRCRACAPWCSASHDHRRSELSTRRWLALRLPCAKPIAPPALEIMAAAGTAMVCWPTAARYDVRLRHQRADARARSPTLHARLPPSGFWRPS